MVKRTCSFSFDLLLFTAILWVKKKRPTNRRNVVQFSFCQWGVGGNFSTLFWSIAKCSWDSDFGAMPNSESLWPVSVLQTGSFKMSSSWPLYRSASASRATSFTRFLAYKQQMGKLRLTSKLASRPKPNHLSQSHFHIFNPPPVAPARSVSIHLPA